MKRDMDLVRHILMTTRDSDNALEHHEFRLADGGWTDDEVMYHIEIMQECGLIEAKVTKSSGRRNYHASVYRLTWTGQDFCDSIADSRVWAKVKDVIKRGVGSASFTVTVQTITKVANELLGKVI
jgi:hypothetical protein